MVLPEFAPEISEETVPLRVRLEAIIGGAVIYKLVFRDQLRQPPVRVDTNPDSEADNEYMNMPPTILGVWGPLWVDHEAAKSQ